MRLKTSFWYIFGFVIFFATIMYLLLLNQRIGGDEAYSMLMIRHSYSEIWKLTAADVHPPLYYFILKTLTYPLGYNLIAAKIVSILPYIFIISFGGVQLKKLFDEKTALIFMVLFFFFPFILGYSTEVRMYSLSAAFVFANAVYAYRCFIENSKTNWYLYVIFGTAAAYTHYFALVSVGIIYGILLISFLAKKKENIIPWMVASAATIVLYLPWLKCFIEQLIYKVNNDYWIDKITIIEITKYFRTVFGFNGSMGRAFSLVVFAAYLSAFVYIINKKNKTDIVLSICALMVPVGTVAIGVVASVLVRPVFVIRYILPASPLLIFFMAFVITKIERKILSVSILSVMFATGAINYGGGVLYSKLVVDDKYEQYLPENIDCYVVLVDNTNPLMELAYYDMTTPIYLNELTWKKFVWEAMPCNNVYPLENFDGDKNDTVVMLTESGEAPTDKWTLDYKSEIIKEIDGYMDVYLLEKKSN